MRKPVEQPGDTPEIISKCLNCNKTYCDNCVDRMYHANKRSTHRCKPIGLYDANNQLISQYSSIKEAKCKSGNSSYMIKSSLKNQAAMSNGLSWRYI